MTRRAFTLAEAALFGALALLVAGTMVALATRGGWLLELSRRSAGSAEELRVLMETMTRDAEELAYVESGEPFDSTQPGPNGFRWIVRTSSDEPGMSPPKPATLRRIEYKLGPPAANTGLRTCERTVEIAAQGATAANSGRRRLATMVSRLRIEPLAAVPARGPSGGAPLFHLARALDPEARSPGAALICLLVELEIGLPAGERAIEETTAISTVTKLWCRNRLLELPRGGRL